MASAHNPQGAAELAHAGQMLIGSQWQSASDQSVVEAVTNPYTGQTVAEITAAAAEDVEEAVRAAEAGAARWRRTPAHERSGILLRAAELADERVDRIAAILSAENGKTIAEATAECSRSGELIRLATFEGTQLYGETLPLDANPGTGLEKVGFTVRQPVGIVAAITPFNYPSLLVLHKIAPALAAGNAVILKPARTTPLTALALAQCFVDAGLPEGVLSVLTGAGSLIGDLLVSDPRIRKISFTGSTGVGERITQIAGVKKLSLELGASSPTVVLPDADLERAAEAVAKGGYANAGQVCISVQRVVVHRDVHADFVDALAAKVSQLRAGDPSSASTDIGTLITEGEAERVHDSIRDAVSRGARLVTGGDRDGAVVQPAIVDGVRLEDPLSQQELFGPAVAITEASDLDDALAVANGTPYGLAAGVFTGSVSTITKVIREVDAGSVHINWTPLWRADLMPYGGLKASGIGKEGPRAAVAEMTEVKTIVLHG